MRIIARREWGAKHDDGFGPASLPAKEVWLHHSVTFAPNLDPPFDDDDAAVRTLENIGQQRFGRGISYSFAVTPSGRVYEGHSIGRQGAHTKGRNSIARAICLVGNYDERKPTAQQLEAVAQLLVHGKAHGWWNAAKLTGGHRDAPGSSTACPGRHAHAAIPGINARAAQLEEDDDMPSADEIAAAVWRHRIRNGFGHTVGLEQIVAATEKRVADLQAEVAQLRKQLDAR